MANGLAQYEAIKKLLYKYGVLKLDHESYGLFMRELANILRI